MKSLLLTFVLLAWAGSSLALDGNFYTQFNGGARLLNDADNSGPSGTFIAETETGLTTSLSLGYALPDSSRYHGGRIEIEAGWRQNGVDQLEFAEGTFSGGGDVTAWSLLLNSYGERRNVGPWTPYVGAGLGVASVSLDSLTVGGSPLADDDDLVLAYQVGVGVDYEFSSRWNIDFGYRYFGTTSPTFRDASGEEFDGEYDCHSLIVGVRMSF